MTELGELDIPTQAKIGLEWATVRPKACELLVHCLIATLLGLPAIITPMASDPFISWSNRTVLRPGREESYLSIQDIVVFVRDVDVSKRFYLEQLGFELLTEQRPLRQPRWSWEWWYPLLSS